MICLPGWKLGRHNSVVRELHVYIAKEIICDDIRREDGKNIQVYSETLNILDRRALDVRGPEAFIVKKMLMNFKEF